MQDQFYCRISWTQSFDAIFSSALTSILSASAFFSGAGGTGTSGARGAAAAAGDDDAEQPPQYTVTPMANGRHHAAHRFSPPTLPPNKVLNHGKGKQQQQQQQQRRRRRAAAAAEPTTTVTKTDCWHQEERRRSREGWKSRTSVYLPRAEAEQQQQEEEQHQASTSNDVKQQRSAKWRRHFPHSQGAARRISKHVEQVLNESDVPGSCGTFAPCHTTLEQCPEMNNNNNNNRNSSLHPLDNISNDTRSLTVLERQTHPNGACVSAAVIARRVSRSPLQPLALKKPIAVVYDARKSAFSTVDASGWPRGDTSLPPTAGGGGRRLWPSRAAAASHSLSASVRKVAAAKRFARMRVAICDSSPARVDASAEQAQQRQTCTGGDALTDNTQQHNCSSSNIGRHHYQQQQRRQEDPERALLAFSKSFKKVKRARTVCSSSNKDKQHLGRRLHQLQRLQQRRMRLLGPGAGRARALSDPSPFRRTRTCAPPTSPQHCTSGGGGGGDRSSQQLTPSTNQLTPAWSTPSAEVRHASFSFEHPLLLHTHHSHWNVPSRPLIMTETCGDTDVAPPDHQHQLLLLEQYEQQPLRVAHCRLQLPLNADDVFGTMPPLHRSSASSPTAPSPQRDPSQQLVDLLAQTSDGIFQLPAAAAAQTPASPRTPSPWRAASAVCSQRQRSPPKISVQGGDDDDDDDNVPSTSAKHFLDSDWPPELAADAPSRLRRQLVLRKKRSFSLIPAGHGILRQNGVEADVAEQEEREQMEETVTFLLNYKRVKLIELYRRKLEAAVEKSTVLDGRFDENGGAPDGSAFYRSIDAMPSMSVSSTKRSIPVSELVR
uniref:Non-specific serine/threonine protein kinase n=1 Tax=Globodera pallida TaxID=36090 RepID=A0A183CGB4_GLOPA